MKKLLLILPLFLLVACEPAKPRPTYCEREIEPTTCNKKNILDKEVFNTCMTNLAKMRGSQGGDYTANDDEDLDDAIDACRYAASPNLYYQMTCEPNSAYIEQQKFCNKTVDGQ